MFPTTLEILRFRLVTPPLISKKIKKNIEKGLTKPFRYVIIKTQKKERGK